MHQYRGSGILTLEEARPGYVNKIKTFINTVFNRYFHRYFIPFWIIFIFNCRFEYYFIFNLLSGVYISLHVILFIGNIKGTHTISKQIEIRPGTKE